MSNVTVLQANFNGGELSPLLDARVDQQKYANGCSVLQNMVVLPHGPATRRSGFAYCGTVKEHGKKVRLLPFVFNRKQAYALEFGHNYMRVWTDGGQVLDAQNAPTEIATPWTEDMLESLGVCQSADIMYIASPSVAVHKLERHGHADWRLQAVTYGPEVPMPPTPSASATGGNGRIYKYVITTYNPVTGEESPPSGEASVSANHTLNTENYVSLSWTESNLYDHRIYKCWNNSGYFGFVGTSSNGKFEDRGATPDFDETPPETKNPFASEHPSLVQFHQQRLCFANSTKSPQTVWMSRTGGYQNMNTSTTLRKDDAVTATIMADRVNPVVWMSSAKKLLLGTEGGEWVVTGPNGEALTPANLRFERQSSFGSAPVPPVEVGDTVLYVQRCGRVVREFMFNLDVDGFTSTDLTVLSEHLTRNAVVKEWTFQQTPYSIVWAVLSNGELAAFTYYRDHKVVGWHRHVTDGVFESICTIPGKEQDEVWVVVKRTVNGQERRYVERLAPFFTNGKLEEAFFVDSGLTYKGTAHNEISGLEHLEGKTVSILADGSEHPDRVVTGGRVMLDREASHVHIGLKFASDLSPMKPELPLPDGTAQGRTKRVSLVWVRLHESLGLKVGPDENSLSEVVFRRAGSAQPNPVPLFSGDRRVTFDGGFNRSAKILLRQDLPLPFTVLAITARIEVGER